MKYIVDENLPDNFSVWNNLSFIHVLKITDVLSDSDIWQYALKNNLTILTKDTDFYYRFLSAHKSPKIVWFNIGNLRKKELRIFIENILQKVESLLKNNNFIIVSETGMEAFK